MNDETRDQSTTPVDDQALTGRRMFLQSLGKWSGAAITAAVAGTWLAGASKAEAGGWVNRRGGGGGGWVNRHTGGGAWVNGGGGGWINRRVNSGAGWVNRSGGGGGAWVNRW
jgi:hypothetical protein